MWSCGTVGLLACWGLCHEALRRLRHNAQPVEDLATLASLGEVCAATKVRAPRLMHDPKVSSPFLSGMLKPAILLPSSDSDLDPAMLRAIFSHEAMHLKRRDLWWNALGRVGCALLWPQPLLWMLCHQIERSSEEACDQAVIAAGCPRGQYAKCLLDFAERLAPRRAESVAGIGVATGKSSVARRVQTILDTSRSGNGISKRARWAIIVGVLVAAATTPLLVSSKAASNPNALLAPDPRLKIIGDWGVRVGGAQGGRLQNMTLQRLLRGKVVMTFHGQSARPPQKQMNFWVLSNARVHRLNVRGVVVEDRLGEVGVSVSPEVSRFLRSHLQAASRKRALQQFQDTPEGRVSIGGVSEGVLQAVSLQQKRGTSIQRMITARTVRRQSPDSTKWVFSDGIIYTFKDELELVSQARFEQLIADLPGFSSFLEQQSQAISQPMRASRWNDIQRGLELPLNQIGTLQEWAKMQSRAAITGRVVNEDGSPVENSRISVSMGDDVLRRILGIKRNGFISVLNHLFALPKSTRELLSRSVTTSADGTYRVEGLAGITYQLSMAQYGRNSYFGYFGSDVPAPDQVLTTNRQVTARGGQTTSAPDLTLTRGGLVHVRVVDKATGTTLPDVTLFGSAKQDRSTNAPSYWVDTDAKGESLFRLPVGKARLSAGGRAVVSDHSFATSSGGVIYSLGRGGGVSLDGSGPQPFVGTTDVQVVQGQTREVLLRLERYVAPAPRPTPFPRQLPPAGEATLIGRVVDEAGRAVAGVEVRAIIQQKAQWKLMQGAGLAYSNGNTPGFDKKWASINRVLFQSARSRADGSFRLEGLTSAPYNLVIASKADFGLKPPANWVANAVEGVWAKEGQQTRRAAPIVLTRGALIVGRVVDKATGLGLGGVVFGSNGPQLPTSTDNVIGVTSDITGRFSLRVAPGVTSLYIAGPNQRASEENIVYADTRKLSNAYRIGTSRGLYAGSDDVEFELDGGSPQFGLNLKSRSEGQIKIPAQKGQTRQITLRLRHLISSPGAKN